MGLESVLSLPTDLASQGLARRRVRLPVLRAEGGDHATIYYFLQTVFQGPSREEFHASLEDPFYEPFDRLLLRRERRIAAHVHITHRTMQFGQELIPAAGLGWLGVAAEHRRQGLGGHLLRAAEKQMEESGALVGMLRTSIPRFFEATGWAPCGRSSFRRADVRTLLARLLDRNLIPRPRRRLHIRPWRQWELPALERLYRQNLEGHGALERTAAYWQWLLNRQGYDEVYVALEGPEQLELGEISTRIVGYAATRGEQIMELMTAPDCPRAGPELLARCCGDAIEHDRHCVLLHARPGHPLFEIFDEAGGCPASPVPEHGEISMMRLLDPPKLLRRLCGEFHRRAAEARLPRPLGLGLLVDGEKYQLEIGRDAVDAASQRIGRSYLRLGTADFTRLVLGQIDWDAAVVDGRLECSTALAQEAGRALFPPLLLWRPPWDDMPRIVL